MARRYSSSLPKSDYRRELNITGTGFVAFVVNGNITVSPTVGGLYSSSAAAVEGVYITSPAGTFSTGASTNLGTERFVGEGTFVAGNFSLQRDLESVGQNSNVSAELFTYNPALLFNMPARNASYHSSSVAGGPDSMREVPITRPHYAKATRGTARSSTVNVKMTN